MAKNSPIETRTSRMAYCSKSPLPSSANWANCFQSTACPSMRGCSTTIPHIIRFDFSGNDVYQDLMEARGHPIPAKRDCFMVLCVHPFDPLSTRCGSHEWIRKVLCFPRNLVVPELHDAHGVGRLAVIRQDEFGDPKITAANESSDRKPLFARLTCALVLYVAPTAGSLA